MQPSKNIEPPAKVITQARTADEKREAVRKLLKTKIDAHFDTQWVLPGVEKDGQLSLL